MQEQQPDIVIIGGGAGGLELATRLGKALGKKQLANITLVDAQNTHFWKPLLHEVAAGSINAFEDELSYLAQAKWNYFRFTPGRMSGINRQDQAITLESIQDDKGKEVVPERTLRYDKLVIAVGSTANDYHTPGAQEYCLFLDNRRQAERIHTTLINHYLHAQASNNPLARLRISIIGAGATGVELAAELHHAAIELERYGLNAIKSQNLELTLVEGNERILPALPLRIGSAVHKQLEKMGIQVMTGQMVSHMDEQGLTTKDGEYIAADLSIWAAGIKAPTFLNELSLEANRINQLVVRPTLQVSKDNNIYAMGDCASCSLTTAKGEVHIIPPRAQAAHQQAALLSKSLVGQIKGGQPLEFSYKDYGSLISLSRYSAVGNLMGTITGDMMLEGALAKWFYISLYRMHQLTLFGKVKTGTLILKDLLSKTTRPHLKLH